MLNTLRYIGITVAAIIGLLLIIILAIPQIDPNRFKDFIETQVIEITGRQLSIEGDIYIEYTLPPLVRVENVHFSNASWGKQPQMLSVGLLQLKMKLVPLLDKQLIVEQLLLEDAYISVEKNAQGQLNWQLEKLTSETESLAPVEPAATESEPFQMPVLPVLKDIRFAAVNFYYHDDSEDIESDVIIENLTLNNADIDEAINISATGSVNKHPYTFSGKTEFLSEVTKENLIDQGIALNFEADALDIAARIDGIIKHPSQARGIAINAAIDADDLDNTFTILSGKSIYQYLRKSEQPLALKASVELSDADNYYNLNDMSLQLAGNDITGNLRYRDDDGKPEIIAELKSDRIDLNRLLPIATENTTENKPSGISASKGSSAGKKIRLPEDKLPFELLDSANAEIRYAIGELHYDVYSPRSILFDASLKNKLLKVKTFDLKANGTPIRSSLKLDASTKPERLHVTLGIEKLQLEPHTKRLDIKQIKTSMLTSIINLTSSGDNINTIIRKLDGEANIRLSDTELEQTIDGRDYSANINNLELIFTGMNQALTYELTGSIDEQPIMFNGELDSPLAILDNETIDVKLNLAAMKARLDVTGQIETPLTADTAKLKIDLDAPQPRQSVIQLSELVPGVQLRKLTPKYPSRLHADLTASPDEYDLKNIRLDIGQSDISGDVSVDLGGDKPSFIVDLESELIDLNELVPATRITAQDQVAATQSPLGTEEPVDKPASTRLFPDKPLPTLAALDDFEVKLDYQLKKLTSNQQAIDNISLHTRLKDSRLIIDPISVDFAKGKIQSRLEVNTIGRPHFTLDKKIIKVDYDRLMAIMGTKEYARGEMDAEIKLSGNGETIHELMASLNGTIRVTTVDGELNNESLKLLSKDLVSIIPFTDTSNRQKIHCGVVQMNIEDGIASTHSMVVNTGAISALGTGDINLANETLSLYVAPRTRRTSVIKLALVPVNITGPLSDPSVRPDVAGSTISTTKTATNVGLTIATGGIWLLAEGLTNDLWDQFIDKTDYCAKALAGEKIVPRRIDLAAEKEKAEQQEIDELLDDEGYDW